MVLDFHKESFYNYVHNKKWNIAKSYDEDMSVFLRFPEREGIG